MSAEALQISAGPHRQQIKEQNAKAAKGPKQGHKKGAA